MNHLTSIAIYTADLPQVLANGLAEELSDLIEVKQAKDRPSFVRILKDANFCIISSDNEHLVQENLPCLVVNKTYNPDHTIERFFEYDPFRNHKYDETKIVETIDTFSKTVKFCLKKFRIPVTPDDSVVTIFELD